MLTATSRVELVELVRAMPPAESVGGHFVTQHNADGSFERFVTHDEVMRFSLTDPGARTCQLFLSRIEASLNSQALAHDVTAPGLANALVRKLRKQRDHLSSLVSAGSIRHHFL
jgi:hypothetical protein